MIPRVVLDSNVVLSALLFARGTLAWMRPAWQHGRFLPLGSGPTLDELVRVLGYPKFRLDADEIVAVLGDYVPRVEVVVRVPEASPGEPVAPDPDDRKFLALAAAGDARWLVTGDAGLPAPRAAGAFEIVTPEVFRGLVSR